MHAMINVLITICIISISFITIYSICFWDKPTHVMYDNYIFSLNNFNGILCLYNLYYLSHRIKPRAILVDVGGEAGLTVRNSEYEFPVNKAWKYSANIGVMFVKKFWNLDDNKPKSLMGTCYEKIFWGQDKVRDNDKPFLGTREVISREVEMTPDGTSSEKVHLGGYKWLTYHQVNQAIKDFSKGLALLKISRHEHAAIFSHNRAECFIALHGCFRKNIVVVILDGSLGEEDLRHSLNEAEVTTVICGWKELTRVVNVSGKLELAKRLICMDDDIPFDVASILHGWTIISFRDVQKLGSKCETPVGEPCNIFPEKVAVIMYTSGSTGLPKGVIVTHGNILAAMVALMAIIPNLTRSDVYLAYLPMAHIFELVIEHVIVAVEGAIGYGSPLTLTDTSTKIKKGTKGDATILVPTLMVAVPIILDCVRDGVLKEVKAKGGLPKKLFDFAYKRRLQAFNGSWFGAWGLENVLWNLLVFRKIRAIMGGRLRFILSSGAPLSANTQRFINICLSAIISQGYGLTETCASGTFSDFEDTTVGRVGLPLACSYIKLIDWAEGGYSTNDSPFPRGEIVIGGTSVTVGYLKNEEKTRESYKVDEKGVRWFYTGDIGRFNADGCLEIIGRKKDIVKLQHGEYVSLGKVEATLLGSPFVDNIMLHVDHFHSYCVALVVVSHPTMEEWASKQGITYSNLVELCNKEEVVKKVYASLVKVEKKACLENFMIPTKIKLLSSPWTPESGLVSATLKIRRESIEKTFRNELSKLYIHRPQVSSLNGLL